MDIFNTPMDVDEDISSETDTSNYDDQNIDLTDDEINEINWRYVFQEILNSLHDNKLENGARPLLFDSPCKIRLKKLGDTPYIFPLSTTLCSRIICEHGIPLSLSNKYDFCGTKIVNSAWQIDHNSIDFPVSFTAAIRTSTLEQLHLNQPHISTHFNLNLHKLIIFGPCSQTKLYNFDDQLFVYHATVLVFLPSNYTGDNYRFIDDNDDDQNIHRHIFNQNDSDKSKPFILVVPSDCQHEIQPIEKGFKLLLVYHLVSKTNSIHELYTLISNPIDQIMSMENAFRTQRLHRLFTYWEKNLTKLSNKLIIPLQHSLDYSSYFSILFRDKYRTTLELIMTAMQSLSSFLIYSAIFQYDEPFGNTPDSRFLIHDLRLLNKTNQIILPFNPQHERTILTHEFLGDLQLYIDSLEVASSHQQVLYNGSTVLRNDLQFHVLLLIPYQYQWDLLLDDHVLAYYHLSYMFSLPTKLLNNLCLNFVECILRNRTSSIYSFDNILHYLIRLYYQFGLTNKMIELIRNLFQNKQFRDELFSNKNLHYWLNRLVEILQYWPMFTMEFLDLFRQTLCLSMPTKLNEVVEFLLQFSHKTLRALLINTLLRSIFKPRTLPRHILFTTFCSILHLLIVDGSYSTDSLLALAYNIIKRVRKTTPETEIINRYFKIHLIPTIINIYRDLRKYLSNHPISPAFILIYEYCLNTLNYFCSSPLIPSLSLSIISRNEAMLICPCDSCSKLKDFLGNENTSTLIYDLSTSLVPDHCLRHTLSKFPTLSIEYKHDPRTNREQTLIVSKCGHEQEQKQLCFHLRRLLTELHKI